MQKQFLKSKFFMGAFIISAALIFMSAKMIATFATVDSDNVLSNDNAKQYYSNFTTQYSPEQFNEHGGYISKSVLQNLLSKMSSPNDSMVFYVFGRNANNNNCVMLFNDPNFHDVTTSSKYVSAAPFCPTACNNKLMDFLSGGK